MNRFLRLFAAFRRLEVDCQKFRDGRDGLALDLQRENASKVLAQERARDLEADNLQLRNDLKTAQDATIHSVKCVADWLAQSRFGMKIYDSAPALSEQSEEPQAVPRGSSQARRMVDEQTAAFYRDYVAREPQE